MKNKEYYFVWKDWYYPTHLVINVLFLLVGAFVTYAYYNPPFTPPKPEIFLFRGSLAFVSSTLLPLLTMEFAYIFFDKYFGDWEKMLKKIVFASAVMTIIELGVWLVSWIMVWSGFELLLYYEGLGPNAHWNTLQPQAMIVHLLVLIPAAVGWLVLRHKNKQVTVSAPTPTK